MLFDLYCEMFLNEKKITYSLENMTFDSSDLNANSIYLKFEIS